MRLFFGVHLARCVVDVRFAGAEAAKARSGSGELDLDGMPGPGALKAPRRFPCQRVNGAGAVDEQPIGHRLSGI